MKIQMLVYVGAAAFVFSAGILANYNDVTTTDTTNMYTTSNFNNPTSTSTSSSVANLFYMTANLGYVDSGAFLPTDNVNGSKPKGSGFGWNVGMGYWLNDRVGFEAAYNWVPNVTYDDNTTNKTEDIYKNQYYIDVAVKGRYELSNTFDVFAKAGAAWVNSETSATNGQKSLNANGTFTQHRTIVPMLGGGADYVINDNISLALQASYLFHGGDAWFSQGADDYYLTPANFEGTLGLNYIFK